jgi:thioredoxin-related protein
MKKLEALSHIVFLGVGILMCVVLTRVYILPPRVVAHPPLPSQAAMVGTNLKTQLPAVDFNHNGQTLVLAISTQCHFCKESSPFYQRLEKEAGKDIKMVAVLPQPVSEAESYLKAEGVRVDQVQQLHQFGTIGVQGTPTMMLVDKNGVVTQVWAGKLQPDQQEQVLAVLKGGTAKKG